MEVAESPNLLHPLIYFSRVLLLTTGVYLPQRLRPGRRLDVSHDSEWLLVVVIPSNALAPRIHPVVSKVAEELQAFEDRERDRFVMVAYTL